MTDFLEENATLFCSKLQQSDEYKFYMDNFVVSDSQQVDAYELLVKTCGELELDEEGNPKRYFFIRFPNTEGCFIVFNGYPPAHIVENMPGYKVLYPENVEHGDAKLENQWVNQFFSVWFAMHAINEEDLDGSMIVGETKIEEVKQDYRDYEPGDPMIVTHRDKVYRCIKAHDSTTSTKPSDDSEYWEFIRDEETYDKNPKKGGPRKPKLIVEGIRYYTHGWCGGRRYEITKQFNHKDYNFEDSV